MKVMGMGECAYDGEVNVCLAMWRAGRVIFVVVVVVVGKRDLGVRMLGTC